MEGGQSRSQNYDSPGRQKHDSQKHEHKKHDSPSQSGGRGLSGGCGLTWSAGWPLRKARSHLAGWVGGTVAVVLVGCTAIGRMLAVGVLRLVDGCGAVSRATAATAAAADSGRMLAVGVRPASSGPPAAVCC